VCAGTGSDCSLRSVFAANCVLFKDCARGMGLLGYSCRRLLLSRCTAIDTLRPRLDRSGDRSPRVQCDPDSEQLRDGGLLHRALQHFVRYLRLQVVQLWAVQTETEQAGLGSICGPRWLHNDFSSLPGRLHRARYGKGPAEICVLRQQES
jgi:hypothetical protein